MSRLAIRVGIAALAAFLILYGCGQEGTAPAGPESLRLPVSAMQIDCGEIGYFSQLSPVLPVWKDSIQTWLGDTELLDDTPVWTDQSMAVDYLGDLVPVLQQWEPAINGALGASLLDTVPDFDPAGSTIDYLNDLSPLLFAWKDSLETERGVPFLPSPPVFVVDDVVPVIVCPGDTSIGCADPNGVVVEFDVTASDNCDPSPVVICDPESGSVFPVGTTEVTCTAMDFIGNESTCTFNVTVATDTQAPTVTNVTASPNLLWPPNHKWVNIDISMTAEDDCDPSPSFAIVEVTSNEDINGHGDGNTEPDWMIMGDTGLKLRAERSGNGDDRVYTVRIRCVDASGNGTEHTVEVTVPHDQGAN